MDFRNRKVYINKDFLDDFWHKHYIWCFDFYITKRWNYTQYLITRISKSSLCYICERELKEDIFYLTDYYKAVCIGKCCVTRYNKKNKKNPIKKRFKLKYE
jgi:hypothetical protein